MFRYQFMYCPQSVLTSLCDLLLWLHRYTRKHIWHFDSFSLPRYRLSALPSHPSGGCGYLAVGWGREFSVLGERIFAYIAYWSYARGWVVRWFVMIPPQTYATCVWSSTFKELFSNTTLANHHQSLIIIGFAGERMC